MEHAIDDLSPSVRGLRAFRVAGIDVRLDPSWILIALLVLLSLSIGYFPQEAPTAGALMHWTAGLVATALLFLSLLLHELAHSWVALRAGISVPEIRLFLFGGVSRMASEPSTPQVELRIALAGPLMSLALAACCVGMAEVTAAAPWMLPVIFTYFAWVNVALAAFNMLPGFPLDGGRVLRALVWWRTGSLVRATKLASSAGVVFSIVLMVLGGLQILAGALVGGIWLILIAMLLRNVARKGYEDVVLRSSLAGIPVHRAMVPGEELVRVGRELPVDELVYDYFLDRGYRAYPVVDGGRAVGIVSSDHVKRVDKGRWREVTVGDVMEPMSADLKVEPEDPLLEGARRLSTGDHRRLLVMRGDELLGLLSIGSLSRFLHLRTLALHA